MEGGRGRAGQAGAWRLGRGAWRTSGSPAPRLRPSRALPAVPLLRGVQLHRLVRRLQCDARARLLLPGVQRELRAARAGHLVEGGEPAARTRGPGVEGRPPCSGADAKLRVARFSSSRATRRSRCGSKKTCWLWASSGCARRSCRYAGGPGAVWRPCPHGICAPRQRWGSWGVVRDTRGEVTFDIGDPESPGLLVD